MIQDKDKLKKLKGTEADVLIIDAHDYYNTLFHKALHKNISIDLVLSDVSTEKLEFKGDLMMHPKEQLEFKTNTNSKRKRNPNRWGGKSYNGKQPVSSGVEQPTHNRLVAGSKPVRATKG